MKKINHHNPFKKMFLFGLILCLILQVPVYAKSTAKKPTCAASQTAYLFTDPAGFTQISMACSFVYIKNISYSSKISNIKCSNSKITATSMLQGDSTGSKMKAISLENSEQVINGGEGLKDGEKATLSFQVKQNGKTYKLSCKLTFKTLPTPLKTLKIGKTNYTSSLSNSLFIDLKLPSSSQKITWQAAKGITVAYVEVFYKDSTSKKIKNGATVNLKNVSFISIAYKLKKPANYQKPAVWNREAPSPLVDFVQINNAS